MQYTHAFYLSVVQLPVNVDLTLCDVACQVRDGVSDICREMGREDGE